MDWATRPIKIKGTWPTTPTKKEVRMVRTKSTGVATVTVKPRRKLLPPRLKRNRYMKASK